MTEQSTNNPAPAAHVETSPAAPESIVLQSVPVVDQQLNQPEVARKEQIDVASTALRLEYKRIGLEVDEKKLLSQAQTLVDDGVPVALTREMHDSDPDILQGYLSAGETISLPQLGVNEIKQISDLPPYAPGSKSEPTRLNRRIVTWLVRASRTASKINSNRNCIGINGVVAAGTNMFCEIDVEAGVIRMTQSIATKNTDGTYTDTKRRVAWIYDKKRFSLLTESAKEWAKQEKFWEHACKLVDIEPAATGLSIDRDPNTMKYFLVRTSDGEKVMEPYTLTDIDGKAADYSLESICGHLLLVSTDPEKKHLLFEAVDKGRWPNDIGFD